jgi:uncharacterized membrane protein
MLNSYSYESAYELFVLQRGFVSMVFITIGIVLIAAHPGDSHHERITRAYETIITAAHIISAVVVVGLWFSRY